MSIFVYVNPCQQWSVGCSEFAPELVHELEPKSQTSVDVFLPSSNRCGSDPSSNYFNSCGITQLDPLSSAKLFSEGATME